MICCVVPRELEGKLRGRLGRALADAGVEVVVEHRCHDRRGPERREGTLAGPRLIDRRRTRGPHGRRVADRRSIALPVSAPEMARVARRHADQLSFFTPIAPAPDYVADVAAARAVLRAQLGDGTAIRELYLEWFDLLASFCRVALPTTVVADETTQDVLAEAIEGLDVLDPVATPFRVYLFGIALAAVEVRRDVESGLDGAHGHGDISDEAVMQALKWVRDHEISFLIGRLPSPQREVLLLRHIARLTEGQAAAMLDLELECARALQADALDRLRETLAALGRGAPSTHREAMRRLSRPSTVLVRRRRALLAT